MKKYLKNTKGMALPMVLIIMVILMLLGTVMAMYAYNSLLSVKWMSDEKKSYYLARAGVEATAYAYQNAVSRTSANYSDLSKSADFTAIDKLVSVSEDGTAEITTNKIYLCYSDDDANAGTQWDGLKFRTFATDEVANADPSVIGYFEVTIGNGIDKIEVADSSGNKQQQDVKVKVFQSSARCGEFGNTMYGYLKPAERAQTDQFYDEDGYLQHDGDFVTTTKTISFNTSITDDNDGWFSRLWKGLVVWVYKAIYGESIDVDFHLKASEGNVVLTKPANAKYIKGQKNNFNFYSFATTGNLFLENCGIDATPSNGKYTAVGLYGDQIVIDEDIYMEVYTTNPNTWLGESTAAALVAQLGNRFRLGTVILGDASTLGTTREDPLPPSQGGLRYRGIAVPANKVFFNGNVYLKIYTQGGSTETYRVFNAGDMAYFYGAYTASGNINGEAYEGRGIDLLKYFIDAVITGSDGHTYGQALINKMKKINELYYGGADSNYFTGDTCLIRKIQVNYNANGVVEVDRGYGSVLDILQPSTVDSSSLTWGRPRGGDSFQ